MVSYKQKKQNWMRTTGNADLPNNSIIFILYIYYYKIILWRSCLPLQVLTSLVWNRWMIYRERNSTNLQRIYTKKRLHREYYTVARRYEFYLRVMKTIFYEWAKRMSKILFSLREYSERDWCERAFAWSWTLFYALVKHVAMCLEAGHSLT